MHWGEIASDIILIEVRKINKKRWYDPKFADNNEIYYLSNISQILQENYKNDHFLNAKFFLITAKTN